VVPGRKQRQLEQREVWLHLPGHDQGVLRLVIPKYKWSHCISKSIFNHPRAYSGGGEGNFHHCCWQGGRVKPQYAVGPLKGTVA
jgi:hypothetical protein